MKQLLMMLTVLSGLTATHAQQVQADPGRTLTSPSETLQENDCVFKNKGIAALQDYQYIVDKCDRRYSPSLMIMSDHLPQGACVYNLVQKMTGYTIARIVSSCPVIENNQEIQGIVPDAPLEEHMPPIPGDEVAAPAKKQGVKVKAKQQEEAAPTAPKNKDEVKPKTADQIEKGNDGYYINPDEIEF
ncbi:MAG: hypothetical protein NDI63_14685 [Pseudobdellovibrio sp.]|nr:hypothetical protein [Pseudobdellovibrio sp.]